MSVEIDFCQINFELKKIMLLLIAQTHHSAVDRNDLEKKPFVVWKTKDFTINACKKFLFMHFMYSTLFIYLLFIEAV